ncbi:MAG: ABC transporter permease subunit [Verrucomicrobia bacterium]|nr:ABC transporter permease subunit [Verrucomicrobiota bacterium]
MLVAILALALLFRLSLVAADNSLDGIKQRGVLKWGADAEGGAPYVFIDPQDPKKLIGFEWDLAAALAAQLGVKAEMVQNQWEGLVPALQRGNFDIILNGLEITAEHRAQIAMSRPYYAYAQQIMVRQETVGIARAEDLRGKAVGVLAASVAQRILEKTGGADLRVYPGNVESFQDLKGRRIDAVLLDLPIAIHFAKSEPALKISGEPFAPGFYGIGTRKEDEALLVALNDAIGKLIENGELQRIYENYGLWDRFQEKLASARTESTSDQKAVSTLRDWQKYLPLLLKGAVVTIEISVLAMVLAVAVGLALALARLFAVTPVRWLATGYIEAIRGTPLLIQLYFIYYGLPNLGISLSAFPAAVLGLGLNYAAYEAENYRAGIQAIPHGQMEAALALGMTQWQALRHIILPQAFRIIIPPVNNDFIALFKDSSLVSVITMVELTKVYGTLAASTYDYVGLGLMTAAIYFGLSYPASLLADHLEKKLR